MALKLSQVKHGTNYPNAYHRIIDVNISKKQGVDVNVEIYTDATEAAADNSEMLLGGFMKTFDYDTGKMDNALTEGYKLIKTLAKYPVSNIETLHPSLEEIFLDYYKNEEKEVC